MKFKKYHHYYTAPYFILSSIIFTFQKTFAPNTEIVFFMFLTVSVIIHIEYNTI